jgi:hypothetical protein
MKMTTTKETTIILGKDEFYLMVIDYLKHAYKIEIEAALEDIHMRVLIGEHKTPAKPTGIRIKYKELE